MRILSTLDELDPLPMLGDRLATPRTEPTQVAPVVTNDWRQCTRGDLQHPDAPGVSVWRDAAGDEFKVTKEPSELELLGRTLYDGMITSHHIDPGVCDETSITQVKPAVFRTSRKGVSTTEQNAEITIRAQREPNVPIVFIRPAEGPVGFETLVRKNHPLIDGRITLNAMFAAGWTRDQLVEHGFAKWVRQ